MGSTRTKVKQLELLPLESDLEAGFRRQGIVLLLAGVDEVGRGPLAGPVVAAGSNFIRSLALPRVYRFQAFDSGPPGFFRPGVAATSPGFCPSGNWVAEIEELGIGKASLKAMALAVQKLPFDPEFVLIDGPWRLPIATAQQPVVKGDQRCLSIAAASVIAKVYRDQLMQSYHQLYPHKILPVTRVMAPRSISNPSAVGGRVPCTGGPFEVYGNG